MTIFHLTKLLVALRQARTLAIACALTMPITLSSALNAPQRSGEIIARQSTGMEHARHTRDANNYLAMIGPAALRFADAPPPLPPEPVLPKPPKPQPPPPEVDLAAAAQIAVTEPVVKPIPVAPESAVSATPLPNQPKPIAILPDDTKQEIRAEDVLPFFQYPGAADSSSLAVPFTTSQPRGSTVPPSSATYRQQ